MNFFKSVIVVIFGFFLTLCAFMSAFAEAKLSITNYHQVFIPCLDQQGQLMIAIRMYYIDATPYFLLVNPYTFLTQTSLAKFCAPNKDTAPAIPHYHYHTMQTLENTPYMQALVRYTVSTFYKIQNYGVTHAQSVVDGMFLTADMCPSRKAFEKDFFSTLVNLSEKQQHAIPIGLSVSGLWILGHDKEFNWLVQQQKANKLQITWINHSFSHPYYNDLPLGNNFLLAKKINFSSEILQTEKLLIENNQLPSVFFRFPGLVSDKKTITELSKFSLIPIGSDAWLAKDQTAKPGSIILVHGNGNEPEGIEKVLPLLQQPNVNLLPLNAIFLNFKN